MYTAQTQAQFQMARTPRAVRAGSLFAAVVMTTVLIGSQIGIAQRYNTEADTVLAAKRAQQPVAQTSAPVTPRKRG